MQIGNSSRINFGSNVGETYKLAHDKAFAAQAAKLGKSVEDLTRLEKIPAYVALKEDILTLANDTQAPLDETDSHQLWETKLPLENYILNIYEGKKDISPEDMDILKKEDNALRVAIWCKRY